VGAVAPLPVRGIPTANKYERGIFSTSFASYETPSVVQGRRLYACSSTNEEAKKTVATRNDEDEHLDKRAEQSSRQLVQETPEANSQ
jgi:hypothetical protein